MLHRHPLLSLLALAYVAFVGLVTLTPASSAPDYDGVALRILGLLERRPELDPLTSRLSVDRIEFLANIGLFVPLGVLVLLVVGTRLWWLAVLLGVSLTTLIESAQLSVPGRYSDPRDVLANSLGMVLGVLVGLVLTLPTTLRRRRQRRQRGHRSSTPARAV